MRPLVVFKNDNKRVLATVFSFLEVHLRRTLYDWTSWSRDKSNMAATRLPAYQKMAYLCLYVFNFYHFWVLSICFYARYSLQIVRLNDLVKKYTMQIHIQDCCRVTTGKYLSHQVTTWVRVAGTKVIVSFSLIIIAVHCQFMQLLGSAPLLYRTATHLPSFIVHPLLVGSGCTSGLS